MATYDHEKVLADYGHGRIDVEMAMGHALQHLSHLYASQTTAMTDRQALRKRLDALEAAVAHLQKVQTDRLQTLENGLSAPTPEATAIKLRGDHNNR